MKIDTREPKFIQEIGSLFFHDKNITTTITELPVGDFEHEKIIFERKEINDFVSSIMDGRYKNQKYGLIKKSNDGFHVYVIIQGNYKDINTEHSLSKKTIAGAIASLNEYGIHTLHTSQTDYAMMFELMYGVIRKFNEEKKAEKIFVEPDTATWTEKCLMCIDGIGKQTAHDIIQKLPHLQRFYESSPQILTDILLEIDGVGQKTAEKVVRTIYGK